MPLLHDEKTAPDTGRRTDRRLVLLDREVLARIRAEPWTRLLPVVISTSSTEESDLVAGYPGAPTPPRTCA